MVQYSSIRHLIAVTSCKGGVGKSTVSLEVAFRLARRGHRVGLFDADVHGPSLATQLPDAQGGGGWSQLSHGGWAVKPREFDGVKLMSFGWFSRLWSSDGNEVRVSGPPGETMTKLLHTTEWGELDYLIVDSPPGTGDVPRALAKKVPLSGAIVVTTPSKLAVVDVVRGVRMLQRFRVPVLAVVENMSSFRCGCGEEHYPFGRGHLKEVLASIGQPLSATTLSAGDSDSDGGGGTGSSSSSSCPTFRLPIVAGGDGVGGGFGATTSESLGSLPDPLLAERLEALIGALEAHELSNRAQTAAAAAPISLPHKLEYHELPHWPTELGAAEYVASH